MLPSAVYHGIFHLPVTECLLRWAASASPIRGSEGHLIPWHDSERRVSWAAAPPWWWWSQVHGVVALEPHSATLHRCLLSGSSCVAQVAMQQAATDPTTGKHKMPSFAACQ